MSTTDADDDEPDAAEQREQRGLVCHSDTISTIRKTYGWACVAMADATPLSPTPLSQDNVSPDF